MAIEITVRHTNALAEIQDYARGKADGLIAEFPAIEDVHIVLDIERHLHIANVLAHARHRARFESRESSDNMRVSIDMAIENVERQMRKLNDRIHDHKGARKPAAEPEQA